MPQSVRAHVRSTGYSGERIVHGGPGLSRVDPPTPPAQQERRARSIGRQFRTAVCNPCVQGRDGRAPERRRSFLVAFARDAQNPTISIDIVEVQAAQLAHSDPGCVKQFDDQPITQCYRLAA